MRHIALTLITLLSLSSFAFSGVNTWTQGNGTGNNIVYALAVDTTTTGRSYAVGGGMWRTTDGGISWLLSTWDPYSSPGHSIAIDPISPNIVWAGVHHGPFRSLDYTSTWQTIGTNLSSDAASINAFYIHPQYQAKMYAATDIGTDVFFVSNDTGMTWQHSSSGMTTGGGTFALVQHPNDYNTFYAGVDGQPAIYVSTDGCSTWQARFTAFGATESLAIDPVKPNILYAGTYGSHVQENGGSIWKSIDGATSWFILNSYPLVKPVTNILVNPENTDIVYLATWGAGAWKTKNGGINWSPITTGLPQIYIWCLAYDSTIHQLYCGTGTEDIINAPARGVWQYTDTDLTSYFPVSIEPKVWQLFN